MDVESGQLFTVWCWTCCRVLYLFLISSRCEPFVVHQFLGLLIPGINFSNLMFECRPQERQMFSDAECPPGLTYFQRRSEWAEVNFDAIIRKEGSLNMKKCRHDLCSLRFRLARNSHRSQKSLRKAIIICHFPKLKTSSSDLWVAIWEMMQTRLDFREFWASLWQSNYNGPKQVCGLIKQVVIFFVKFEFPCHDSASASCPVLKDKGGIRDWMWVLIVQMLADQISI